MSSHPQEAAPSGRPSPHACSGNCSTGLWLHDDSGPSWRTGHSDQFRGARRRASRLIVVRRYPEVGASKATILLQDFRIYVSEVRLVSSDGQEVPVRLTPDNQWQNDSVALLDFENATGNCNGNASTNSAVKGVVPKGDYTGPDLRDRRAVLPEPQGPDAGRRPAELQRPHLAVARGLQVHHHRPRNRRQAAAEDAPAEAATGMSGMVGMNASGFSIHLGSTNCGAGSPTTPPTSPCENPNRPTYPAADIQSEVAARRTRPGCAAGEHGRHCKCAWIRVGLHVVCRRR